VGNSVGKEVVGYGVVGDGVVGPGIGFRVGFRDVRLVEGALVVSMGLSVGFMVVGFMVTGNSVGDSVSV